jgi:hypothetical protein
MTPRLSSCALRWSQTQLTHPTNPMQSTAMKPVHAAVVLRGLRHLPALPPQVVVVAAGFDTRAYRIGAQHKGVNFFEVDLPHTSKWV